MSAAGSLLVREVNKYGMEEGLACPKSGNCLLVIERWA